jgi:cytochrome oxidase Cu insertion factor (SCO1/SenC/PrrC family)
MIRGKRAETLPAVVSLLLILFFGFLDLSFAQLPLSTGAPSAGQKAPGFTLPDQQGKPVSLGGLLKPGGTGKFGGLVLIFYRGYW